ncbi:hypothetical protein B4923_17140 [Brenneria roseae subsp. americana]|uniref:Hemolysin expression modulator Hha n=1 Tax=Brenneria roseae subsp. americana TaxID=1508507 RepID=A0A2U1TL70_9GAMM|nr:Hha/YmoA family nucleoid-associated regulatory protein [Brenneria roseae]PWC10157.1 hypothetical protein B4923_17140 [Brenneria roseae subsp. americana]PWC22944.1 hypothetical protein DDT52_01370 [Brenneria roseae subsp. roseae]
MTKLEYLMKFRRCSNLDTLERVYEHMQEKVPVTEQSEFESACDHRRAEIIHHRLWDRVPATAWKNVV